MDGSPLPAQIAIAAAVVWLAISVAEKIMRMVRRDSRDQRAPARPEVDVVRQTIRDVLDISVIPILAKQVQILENSAQSQGRSLELLVTMRVILDEMTKRQDACNANVHRLANAIAAIPGIRSDIHSGA